MSRSISYAYSENGYASTGRKLPNVPVVDMILRRSDRRLQARGPAIVDTGFDGAVYPSLEVLSILNGMQPVIVEHLFHPLYGRVDCEVYELEGYLVDNNIRIPLGIVRVYAPTEPEYVSNETLIGREIINKYKILLNGLEAILTVEEM